MDPTGGKTTYLVQREGADAFMRSPDAARRIEPLPRTISATERWLVNVNTGRIEMASPLMRALGDVAFVEYEPTAAEVDALRQGKAVVVSATMLARLKNPGQANVADRLELPAEVAEQVRRDRYQRLHGHPPDTAAPQGEGASVASAAPALMLPAEATPSVPGPTDPAAPPVVPVLVASAFSLSPVPGG